MRRAGCPTVVTNTTFRLAPWADVLFGFDARWWSTKDPRTGLTYAQESQRDFRGRRMSRSALAINFDVEALHASSWFRGSGNSGSCAISLAVSAGARRVVLLGFDCTFAESGQRHWHGDHPAGLGNCLSIARWPLQFSRIKRQADAARAEVINCSRRTALDMFTRRSLESVLAELAASSKQVEEV